MTRTGARLPRSFFARDTLVVARALIGTRLVSTCNGATTVGRVVETEAYPPGDSTSHAYRRRTRRNAPMFAAPGTAYVYFTYGMHECANVSTEAEDVGAAVLLRAVEPIEGLEVLRARRGDRVRDRDLARGPARLCVAMGISRAHDGIDLCGPDSPWWFEVGPSRVSVDTSPRIGVRGLSEDVMAPRRFTARDSRWVSGPAGR